MIFFNTAKQFGELDEDVVEKLKYAKWKAADITTAIREGRVPTPGPAAPEEDFMDESQFSSMPNNGVENSMMDYNSFPNTPINQGSFEYNQPRNSGPSGEVPSSFNFMPPPPSNFEDFERESYNSSSYETSDSMFPSTPNTESYQQPTQNYAPPPAYNEKSNSGNNYGSQSPYGSHSPSNSFSYEPQQSFEFPSTPTGGNTSFQGNTGSFNSQLSSGSPMNVDISENTSNYSVQQSFSPAVQSFTPQSQPSHNFTPNSSQSFNRPTQNHVNAYNATPPQNPGAVQMNAQYQPMRNSYNLNSTVRYSGAPDMNQAYKYGRFAVSALQFEDVPTAIQNLKNALVLLGGNA